MDHPSRPRPLVIAHRGASGCRPEHSGSAVRLGFAQGADAVEPDLVASSDGVLVIRHENELSGTTDVADRPEFADRRVARVVDGVQRTGWFTEDMTWAEIRTLRCRERIPAVRPGSAAHDDEDPVLSLPDLLRIVDEESARLGRALGMVAEIKHATHFQALGLPLDELLARDLEAHGWAGDASRLTVESFERDVLMRVRARGIQARLVYLVEGRGSAVDEVARHGAEAVTFDEQLTDAGLAALAADVDGISVGVERICPARGFRRDGGIPAPVSDLVDRAHAAGLAVFTWTLRPEDAFLPKPLRSGAAGPGAAGPGADHGDFRAFWGRLLDSGVDGVFVDHPDLAVGLLADRSGGRPVAAASSASAPDAASSAAAPDAASSAAAPGAAAPGRDA